MVAQWLNDHFPPTVFQCSEAGGNGYGSADNQWLGLDHDCMATWRPLDKVHNTYVGDERYYRYVITYIEVILDKTTIQREAKFCNFHVYFFWTFPQPSNRNVMDDFSCANQWSGFAMAGPLGGAGPAPAGRLSFPIGIFVDENAEELQIHSDVRWSV